jgi:hypothetical protein
MLVNPPPDRCQSCHRPARAEPGTALTPGDRDAWIALEGPEVILTLEGGAVAVRRGRGWVCRRCGHTVPVSREFAR